ncbi:hypothetical protein R1sor_019711 [Riccia sorocarpa]|uniref:Uncharacterized protein n=1 Tax=Riccia sorocarpa TaxID=122646 RepID=A0ABD3IJI4_9MARC
MDVDSMENPARRRQIKAAWEEGWELSPDPAIAWEMAWAKARELFKKYHKEDREKISELKAQQKVLAETRERIQGGATAGEIESYRNLEKTVHAAELLEARSQEESNSVLSLLDRSVTEEENGQQADLPSRKEITELIDENLHLGNWQRGQGQDHSSCDLARLIGEHNSLETSQTESNHPETHREAAISRTT